MGCWVEPEKSRGLRPKPRQGGFSPSTGMEESDKVTVPHFPNSREHSGEIRAPGAGRGGAPCVWEVIRTVWQGCLTLWSVIRTCSDLAHEALENLGLPDPPSWRCLS